MKCEVCKEEKENTKEYQYTMRVKEDVYSPTLKETLKAGTQITVYLPTCPKCLEGVEDLTKAASISGDK